MTLYHKTVEIHLPIVLRSSRDGERARWPHRRRTAARPRSEHALAMGAEKRLPPTCRRDRGSQGVADQRDRGVGAQPADARQAEARELESVASPAVHER